MEDKDRVPSEAEAKVIAEARVKTGDFIARLMMSYAGFATFCVFTLLSPDRLIITGQASLNVPIAGNVSFLAFMVVAPTVLIGMRVYLEFYLQHWRGLDANLTPKFEPQTISPLKHRWLRISSAIVLYPLLPAMLVLFTWKAAAKDVWGDAFLCLTVIATVAQTSAIIRWSSAYRWAMNAMGVLVGLVLFVSQASPDRGLELVRADLQGAHLADENLRGAHLSGADLSLANLSRPARQSTIG